MRTRLVVILTLASAAAAIAAGFPMSAGWPP
jgi:hypothetical protein